jgi:hypothetical protein
MEGAQIYINVRFYAKLRKEKTAETTIVFFFLFFFKLELKELCMSLFCCHNVTNCKTFLRSLLLGRGQD